MTSGDTGHTTLIRQNYSFRLLSLILITPCTPTVTAQVLAHGVLAPACGRRRVHKLSKTRRDETQCGFLIERWFFARYWAAKIPSTPKGFG